MKKIKLLLLSFILILSLLTGVVACGGDDGGDVGGDVPPIGPTITNVEGTAGLAYEVVSPKKGTAYAACTGIGTATDTDIVIASHYNGYVVEQVDDKAFKDNVNITSVTFVNGMVKINMYAFQGCTSLFSVSISETVNNIGQNAFYKCENLLNICNDSELDIKMGSTQFGYVGNYACNIYSSTGGGKGEFKVEGDYQYFTYPNNKFAMKYLGNETAITIPSDVTGLYKDLFKDNTTLKEIVIPSSVQSIGKSAFANCTALEKVTINENTSLQSIAELAFTGCESLVEYNFNDDLTTYLKVKYAGDTSNPTYYSKEVKIGGNSIYDLTIPNGVKEISSHAFVNCEYIQKLLLAPSVEIIGSGAFAKCTKLKFLWFSDKPNSTLKHIMDNAFNGCISIEELDFPKSLEIIDVKAFNECKGLLTLTFENNNKLKEIRQRAFWHCDNLKSTFLGHNSSIEVVGEEAFRYCGKMTTFNMGNNCKIKELERFSLSECRILKEIYIPSTCTILGDYVFSGCFNGWPREEADYCKIYADFDIKPLSWHTNFNSSNCPVYYNTPYPTLPE